MAQYGRTTYVTPNASTNGKPIRILYSGCNYLPTILRATHWELIIKWVQLRFWLSCILFLSSDLPFVVSYAVEAWMEIIRVLRGMRLCPQILCLHILVINSLWIKRPSISCCATDSLAVAPFSRYPGVDFTFAILQHSDRAAVSVARFFFSENRRFKAAMRRKIALSTQ